MFKKRVLIIGPFPPPLGGVSQHIFRLAKLIDNNFYIDIIDESRLIKDDVFNIRSFKMIQYIRKIRKSDIIFIHSGSNILRIFHLLIGFVTSRKIILTVHSYPYKKIFLLKLIDDFIFKLANSIIVVNSDILERISIPKEKCIIKPAFLPPVMEEETELPGYVTDWISDKKYHNRLILCANATRLNIYKKQDLYGLDMCISVTKTLLENGLPISFVFNVSSLDKGRNLFLRYKAMIENSDLSENFLLLNEELSFVRLIEQADIILRPTNTDGDALTVREALYLGKTVIASDIVKRPTGSILFKSRDVNDLKTKLLDAINSGIIPLSNRLTEGENEYRLFYSELITNTLHDIIRNDCMKNDHSRKSF